MKSRSTRWTSRLPKKASFQTVLPPRKDRTLRVYASDDPTVRHFKWPLEDPAAAGLHAFSGRVDIADIEVIKPVWDLLYRTFGEHAADRLPAGGEQLIRVLRTEFGVRFLPAEKLAVESKRLLPVGGEQLMPAHALRFVQIGRLLLTVF